jgi:hypothetical protein
MPARLNVDVIPQILASGLVRVELGLEYNPRQAPGTEPGHAQIPTPGQQPSGGTSLNERVTLVLEPGKSLMISQAADPISDRKITVEVRATILK